jgi:hypothetical protein
MVDSYSNDDYVIVHTDKGEVRCGKRNSSLMVQDENNQWVEMSHNDAEDLLDNWIGYCEKNHDEFTSEFEDHLEYDDLKDSGSLIRSLRER